MTSKLNSEREWISPPEYGEPSTWPRDGEDIYVLVEEDVVDTGMNYPPQVLLVVAEHIDPDSNHGQSLRYRIKGLADYLEQDETVVAWRQAK